ncbi:MAG: succinate dehydrogenase cytochrome b subunit [Bacteroidota bacterium]|nr:succinate dehydrogenase cytochrome b subunit [Bacteroidota bacterium]
MNWFTRTFSYSIGKKVISALTGLFLILFLAVHLIGNIKLFVNDGGIAFNEHSHTMTQDPLIRVIEIFLFASIIFHSIDGVILALQNNKARPIKYVAKRPSPGTKLSSRTMILSGLIILFFICIHLYTFFVPYRITGEVTDIYKAVEEAFASPLYAGFYVFCMILLGLHLFHAFTSAFQTLGFRHPKYYPFIKALGSVIAIVYSVGFASMPIYFLFKNF